VRAAAQQEVQEAAWSAATVAQTAMAMAATPVVAAS
jgi:hypothetical protein